MDILDKIKLEESKKIKLSKDGDITIDQKIANHVTIRDESVGAVISINRKYWDDLLEYMEIRLL